MLNLPYNKNIYTLNELYVFTVSGYSARCVY